VDHALTTFGLLSGLSREDIQNKIPEVLEIVNLVDARKRKIKHLSGGMQQKLKLAQALLHEPKILVLDEPMSGLDPTSRFQMKNIIRKLAKQDITIIFSSHILKEVEDIVTTIGIINKGKVVKLGKPEEMQKEIIGGEAIEIIGKNIAEKADIFYQFEEITKVETQEDYPNNLTIIFQPEINLEAIIVRLLDFLASNKIAITNFNYVKPSLEQVYMKYVMEEAA
jgi:ABC-2 type transport system ATP-binding protein